MTLEELNLIRNVLIYDHTHPKHDEWRMEAYKVIKREIELKTMNPVKDEPKKHDYVSLNDNILYPNGTFCKRCGQQIGSGADCI